MSTVDRSRVDIVLGEYGVTSATALSDASLLPKVQEHRRTLGQRLVPLAKEDVKRRLPAGEYHVSKKLDGEYAALVWDGDEVFTLNPGGTVRVGLPFAAEAAKRLRAAKLGAALIAGELHVVRPDGARSRVHDVGSVAAHPADAAELGTLRFAAFDLVEPAPATAAAGWKTLVELFGDGEKIGVVESADAVGVSEVLARFESWVEQGGAEGIVVRSETAGYFKIKPKHTLDCVVLGFTEALDERKGMLHDVLVGLLRADGTYHLLGRVGGGFSDDDRRAFLADLGDLVAESEYSEVNSDHVAYRMVRPEWVIELSCLNLVASTTRGSPIDRMVLSWVIDGTDGSGAGRWAVVRRLPLVSVIGPSFLRRRTDKQPSVAHAGLAQVTRIVSVPGADRDAVKEGALPKSEVLRRDVYTKVMKGQTMVRKLVLWKTNKEQQSADFPAFVAHLTDYSPNRKTPLEREVRVSSSRAQIDAMVEALAAESFGRGWSRA